MNYTVREYFGDGLVCKRCGQNLEKSHRLFGVAILQIHTSSHYQKDQDNVRKALKVMVLTPHIRAYLEGHDPKALEQATTALLKFDKH